MMRSVSMNSKRKYFLLAIAILVTSALGGINSARAQYLRENNRNNSGNSGVSNNGSKAPGRLAGLMESPSRQALRAMSLRNVGLAYMTMFLFDTRTDALTVYDDELMARSLGSDRFYRGTIADKNFYFTSGTIQAGTSLSATKIVAGRFGQDVGGGDFSFPGNVTTVGNIAVGNSTLPPWHPALVSLQVGGNGMLASHATTGGQNSLSIALNSFYAINGYKYVSSGKASQIYLNEGAISFQVASAGTAGTPITWTDGLFISNSGNVGIGTISPSTKLQVAGQISASGGFVFPDGTVQMTAAAGGGGGTTSVLAAANISAGQFGRNTGGGNFSFPGDVTVAGNIAAKYQDLAEWVPTTQKLNPGTVVSLDRLRSNHVLASTSAYDTAVAGVVSAQPGIALGEGGEGKVLIATTGRVRIKVDATKAPIRVGDLLVTSGREGIAMRSEPIIIGGRMMHAPGTIIGKALESLETGTGEILVLLSLQ